MEHKKLVDPLLVEVLDFAQFLFLDGIIDKLFVMKPPARGQVLSERSHVSLPPVAQEDAYYLLSPLIICEFARSIFRVIYSDSNNTIDIWTLYLFATRKIEKRGFDLFLCLVVGHMAALPNIVRVIFWILKQEDAPAEYGSF